MLALPACMPHCLIGCRHSCRGSIKGGSADDEAVLCTQERTYALKHVQTTNTVLLMPPAAQVPFFSEHVARRADSL